MTHKKWWCNFIYKENCPVCKVRQFRYGFRMDFVGYMEERKKVAWNTNYTTEERLWILDQVHPIKIY